MNTSFHRQVTSFISLLLAVTVLLGVGFLAFFDRYVTRQQETSLYSTGNSVSVLLQAFYEDYYLDEWELRTNLSVAASASENDILLCDTDGTVRICARDIQDCVHLGKSLDSELVERIFDEGSLSVASAASELYGEKRLAVAVGVVSGEGERLCIVLTSLERTHLSSIVGSTLRIFVMTALVVLLAALLVMFCLARRETGPIRNMAAAARQIAHGNLSVRVPTGYANEEIEELAVAFNNMATSVQHSDKLRQEFVANVSHELKTPMTTISGYLDGMLDGTIPPEQHPHYMELVAAEARRLSRLVRNMLDISRLKDQGIPPEKLTDFDICELACQALLSFEQRINRKNLNVQVEMPELGLQVHALADYVTQVLYNLIDNAVKFVNEGGELTIRVQEQGSKAVIRVGNTGPTIAAEELPLIFERFHKTDKSRSTDRDGVGLGLYIVKTIVLAHGEDVYVTSVDGKTEFTFTMPLAK